MRPEPTRPNPTPPSIGMSIIETHALVFLMGVLIGALIGAALVR